MSQSELLDLIEAAFPEASRPISGTLSEATYDDEGTNSFFGGTDWRAHSTDALREHAASLSFFTPEAFRYYLPAFLVCSIRDPEKADVIPEGIVSKLDRDRQEQGGLIAGLTSAERHAVARFVEWLRDDCWETNLQTKNELTALVQALEFGRFPV